MNMDFPVLTFKSLRVVHLEAKERMISSFEQEYLTQLMDKHQMNISKMAREGN